jgi:hypothetical protein
MIKQKETLSQVLYQVMRELNDEILLFSLENNFEHMFGYKFHYMGYEGLFNLVSNEKGWQVTEVSSEDGRILKEEKLVENSKEEVKKALYSFLKQIKQKQRIKEMLTPSTYFFDKLIGEIQNEFSFILLEDLIAFKKTLYETLCTVLSSKEIMELSAREWKSGRTYFHKVEQKVINIEMYSCVFLGFYFFVEMERGDDFLFVFFEKDKEKAKKFFEESYLEKHRKQIQQITSVMERWI